MKRCVIIGRPNAGKTRFVIGFARSIGSKQIDITALTPSGERKNLVYTVDQAIENLISDRPHHTVRLQSIRIALPVGKGVKRFDLVDTTGLIDRIHPDRNVREAMAQTVTAIKDADLIIHVIDADRAGDKGPVRAIGEVDFEVARFARATDKYLILANKMDLPKAQIGFENIRRQFPAQPVIPVSALRSEGLQEVKRFVRSRL